MRTNKITGIKSVDFKIIARGHGVVNWNGATNLARRDGMTVDNHTLPKLRGYSNLTGKVKDTGYKYRKEPTDIDFTKTPLYVSQNCIRHHLFKEQAYDAHFAKEGNIQQMLASLTGLVRGYVVPASQSKRASALLIEDFVDQLGNGNFEQFSRCGSKAKEANKKGEDKSSTFFSKTTFGDTEYLAYGSISIEQLQFISLNNKFDRACMNIKSGQGEDVAANIQAYLQTLREGSSPKAVFHNNYVRAGTIYEEGEAGILLDNEAIDILIEATIDKIRDLTIRQCKSYLYVDEVMLDYNDSNKMMRIKRDEMQISGEKNGEYAVYFYAKEEA